MFGLILLICFFLNEAGVRGIVTPLPLEDKTLRELGRRQKLFMSSTRSALSLRGRSDSFEHAGEDPHESLGSRRLERRGVKDFIDRLRSGSRRQRSQEGSSAAGQYQDVPDARSPSEPPPSNHDTECAYCKGGGVDCLASPLTECCGRPYHTACLKNWRSVTPHARHCPRCQSLSSSPFLEHSPREGTSEAHSAQAAPTSEPPAYKKVAKERQARSWGDHPPHAKIQGWERGMREQGRLRPVPKYKAARTESDNAPAFKARNWANWKQQVADPPLPRLAALEHAPKQEIPSKFIRNAQLNVLVEEKRAERPSRESGPLESIREKMRVRFSLNSQDHSLPEYRLPPQQHEPSGPHSEPIPSVRWATATSPSHRGRGGSGLRPRRNSGAKMSAWDRSGRGARRRSARRAGTR